MYDRVIQEVCEASRVDFEEGGVDQQTLEEMRRVSLYFIFLLLYFVVFASETSFTRPSQGTLPSSFECICRDIDQLEWQKRGSGRDGGWEQLKGETAAS